MLYHNIIMPISLSCANYIYIYIHIRYIDLYHIGENSYMYFKVPGLGQIFCSYAVHCSFYIFCFLFCLLISIFEHDNLL